MLLLPTDHVLLSSLQKLIQGCAAALADMPIVKSLKGLGMTC